MDECESQKSVVNSFVIYYVPLSVYEYLPCQIVSSQSKFDLHE